MQILPASKRAYVSAEAESSATISGPPSTLAALFSTDVFYEGARKIKLPITAAFHAPHLGNPDIDTLLDSTSNHNDLPVRDDVVVVSTSSAKPIPATTLGGILEHIIADTLQRPIKWSQVAREIVARFVGQSAIISSAGPVHAANSLSRDMIKAKIEVVERTDMLVARGQPLGSRSDDIAIVGFASRLPETETLEEVWELLEKGRDVHKKVI